MVTGQLIYQTISTAFAPLQSLQWQDKLSANSRTYHKGQASQIASYMNMMTRFCILLEERKLRCTFITTEKYFKKNGVQNSTTHEPFTVAFLSLFSRVAKHFTVPFF